MVSSIVMTDKNLYAIMLEHFGMKENLVRSKIKGCGFKNFKAEEWDKYILCLTGIAPCTFCHSPRKQSFDIVPHKRFGDVVCILDKMHYHLEVTEERIMYALFKKPGLSIYPKDWPPEVQASSEYIKAREAAHSMAMKECNHGNYKYCCIVCATDEVNRRMEN